MLDPGSSEDYTRPITSMFKVHKIEQLRVLPQMLKWLLIGAVVSAMAGSVSAIFLFALDWATAFRESHLWIIALLPVGGLGIGCLYHYLGREVEAGNDLVLEEIHNPKSTLKARMTPLILIGTVLTHLFGGSGGREGVAVQMGASLADQLTGPLKLTPESRRILLMSGMSAGFASVFGTPLAGAIFGLEVLSIGKLQYDAILPCFASAFFAHLVTLAWGVHHLDAAIGVMPSLGFGGILISLLAGAVFGIAGMIFATLTHRVGDEFKKRVDYAPLRPMLGGLILAVLVYLIGNTRYIGLGIPTILESFKSPLPPWDFAMKILLTALTLGAGFKGGEVTPLFFIGATLGNALSHVLPLPMPLLAAMGFAAVFSGASNTPIASTLLAIEIFGSQVGTYCGLACVGAYLFSGHAGIYRSQRIGFAKHL